MLSWLVEMTASSNRRFAASLVAIVAAATALRVHALGQHGLWLDEIAAVLRASENIGQLIDPRTGHPPLYYVVLSYWIEWGTAEGWVRALSVAFGLACLPIVYALGTEAGGRLTGRLALFFAAASPIHVWVSREARSYVLMNLLVLLSVWLWRKTRRTESGVATVTLGISAAGALYTHYYALFGLVAVAMAALASGDLRDRSVRRRLLTAGTVAVFAFSPMIWAALDGARQLSVYAEEVASFALRNTVLPKTILYLLARSDPAHLAGAALEAMRPGTTFTWLSLSVLALITWGAWRGRSSAPGFDGRTWLLLVALPVVLAAMASAMGSLFLDARYLTQTSLFLAVPAAVALQALTAGTRRLVLLLSVAAALVAISPLYARPTSQIREAVREIDARSASADCVAVVWNKAHCYRFYSRNPIRAFDLPAVPGLQRELTRASPLKTQAVQPDDMTAIATELARCRRVWLLLNDTTVWGVDMGAQVVQEGLVEKGFVKLTEIAFSDTTVQAYAPPSPR